MPNEPFEEDDDVKEGAEDPIMSEVPGIRIIHENDGKDNDTEDINSMNNYDRGWNIP